MFTRWIITFLRHGGISLVTELLTSIACEQHPVPSSVYGGVTSLGICAMPLETVEAKIPSLFFSTQIKGVTVPPTSLMPDTMEMSRNRLELGKLMVALEFVQVDAFVEGIQSELGNLYQVPIKAQEELDACDNPIQQIFATAGNYLKDHDAAKDDSSRARLWALIIFQGGSGGNNSIREAPVEKAVEDFDAFVIKATQRANLVVMNLSSKLVEVIGGIEAACRYPDKMTAIDMSMRETGDVASKMLRKLKNEIETDMYGW